MTNSIPNELAWQQLATHAGYNLSGPEIGLIMSLAGTVVHIAHQAVKGWGAIGGLDGVKTYFLKGSKP
jgi:hypothetical protein